MVTKEKKIFNFRPIFLCFIGLMLGIICTLLAFKQQFVMLIIIISVLAIFSVCILIGLFIKTKFFEWFLIKSKVFLCVALAIILGGFACYLQVKNYNDASLNNRSYEISGRVCEIDSSGGYIGIILENCKTDGKSVNKNIYSLCYDGAENDFAVGSNITFTGRISCVKIIPEERYVNDFYLTNNIGYVTSFASSEAIVESGKMQFDEIVRQKVESYIKSNMGADASGIALAVLIGDKSGINEMTKSYYSASGISHILAISGLHVGFLVALLHFILKKIKAKKYVSFALLTIFLILYCYVCGFPASVVRASVMSIVLLLSTIIGQRNDGITNLSVAGILLLCINPLQIFNLGFQLSFACVFGIVCLYKPVYKFFDNFKIPSFINAPMSICLICQFATLPFILNYFEFISALGLITNLICLPLFSFAFCFLFIATLLGIIIPFLSFLLFVPELIFTVISGVAQFITSINVGIYKFISFSLVSILFFMLLIYFLSKYILIKSKSKIIVNISIIFVFVLITIFTSMPTRFNELSLLFAENLDNTTIITTESNNKFLINVGTKGTDGEFESIKSFLKVNKILNIDAIALVEFKNNTRNNLIEICNNYQVEKLFVPSNVQNKEIIVIENALNNTQIIVLQDNQINNMNDSSFCLHYFDNLPKALEVNSNNKKIVFCATSLNAQETDFVKQTFNSSIDILRVNNYNKAMWDCNLTGNITIANNILAVPLSNYINLKVESSLKYRVI